LNKICTMWYAKPSKRIENSVNGVHIIGNRRQPHNMSF